MNKMIGSLVKMIEADFIMPLVLSFLLLSCLEGVSLLVFLVVVLVFWLKLERLYVFSWNNKYGSCYYGFSDHFSGFYSYGICQSISAGLLVFVFVVYMVLSRNKFGINDGCLVGVRDLTRWYLVCFVLQWYDPLEMEICWCNGLYLVHWDIRFILVAPLQQILYLTCDPADEMLLGMEVGLVINMGTVRKSSDHSFKGIKLCIWWFAAVPRVFKICNVQGCIIIRLRMILDRDCVCMWLVIYIIVWMEIFGIYKVRIQDFSLAQTRSFMHFVWVETDIRFILERIILNQMGFVNLSGFSSNTKRFKEVISLRYENLELELPRSGNKLDYQLSKRNLL